MKKLFREITVKKLYCMLLIAVCIGGSTFATGTSEATTIINSFTASDNSVEKSRILFSLNSYLPQKPPWVKRLFKTALNDRSPVVVADAVRQIGAFGFSDCNTDLIRLYKGAEKRFGSAAYVERVQCAIIQALGEIGNGEAKRFISGLLKSDNGSYKGRFLLSAVAELHDPVFIEDIRLYSRKLEKYVAFAKERGREPFLYSEEANYIEQIKKIEQVLLKGGK